MPYDKQIFAENLNIYLDSVGENQSDICKLCGVSSSTASGWCTGQIMPRMDKVKKLADHFGCRISDLVESRKPAKDDDSLKFPYRISEEILLQQLVSKCNADMDQIAAEVTRLQEKDQLTLLSLSFRILSTIGQGKNIVVSESPIPPHPETPQIDSASQDGKDTVSTTDGPETQSDGE